MLHSSPHVTVYSWKILEGVACLPAKQPKNGTFKRFNRVTCRRTLQRDMAYMQEAFSPPLWDSCGATPPKWEFLVQHIETKTVRTCVIYFPDFRWSLCWKDDERWQWFSHHGYLHQLGETGKTWAPSAMDEENQRTSRNPMVNTTVNIVTNKISNRTHWTDP